MFQNPETLLSSEVQLFIREHEDIDERRLLLKHPLLFGLPASAIATQIAGRRKAKTKLPTFYAAKDILYPPILNLEQSSSEQTAKFKATFLRSYFGKTQVAGADLTGGFGVDAFFLSLVCYSFTYVEPDVNLSKIVIHNHSVLGNPAISYINQTAEEFVEGLTNQINFAFIDPSRRKSGQKVFRLADCSPDIVKLMPALLSKSQMVMVKTSPLLDITQAIKELACVNQVFILAVRNECKELLFICDGKQSDDLSIRCLNFGPQESLQEFHFFSSEEKNVSASFADPMKYIYEPNAAIMKAGAFKLIGETFRLSKIERHTHLYTSDVVVADFPGRIFEVVDKHPSPLRIRAYFQNGLANVIVRNYPATAEEVKKKYKLKDGGENYLIGFTGASEKFLLTATRIQ